MDEQFILPVIVDADINWACEQLRLPTATFFETVGSENRRHALKSLGRLDIAACPGSGKTTLLVAKLAILAEKWPYKSHGICVLSHTNVARNEIESRLGHTSGGQRLSGHPHFIGTIHGFVNEYLAIPWLQSKGLPVRMIDDEVCLARRWFTLPYNTRFALEKAGGSSEMLRVKDPDFGVGDIPWGKSKSPLGTTTATYQAIRAACQKSAQDGFYCHDEMLMWAHDLLGKQSLVTRALRNRFPLLFIDEAQDTDDEQAQIVDKAFIAGANPVICQRFGDGNQAIFNSPTTMPTGQACAFPDTSVKCDLPVSHRFGQLIADLADPLGLVPYNLQGKGPRCAFSSGAGEGRHTIFLFRDKDGAGRVLPAYGDLLLETFSAKELRDGLFKAVGQVHATLGDSNFPGNVAHYWDAYDPDLSRSEPRPKTFVQYLFAGVSQAIKRGEAFPAVEKIAEGILRGAAICVSQAMAMNERRKHQKILQALSGHAVALKNYLLMIQEYGVRHVPLTKTSWIQIWRSRVKEMMEVMAGAMGTGADLNEFLAWKDSVADLPEAVNLPSKRENIERFSRGEKVVLVHLGSIHSVKGETHTSTLVLETFWYNHNLTSIREWLVGDRAGGGGAKSRDTNRLKLHYVAMTRPSHLLCLALPMDRFLAGKDGGKVLEKLRARGWNVTEV
jgi:DNA helicase-2/ATP-dependent DNA helicase PcrA